MSRTYERDGAGVVVLRGAGRCFSAGHDLGDIAGGEKLPRPRFQSHVIERLADLPLPVITAVHGHCYTGALELALAGDIIFAAEKPRFADTHAEMGARAGLGPQPALAAPHRRLQGARDDVHLPHLVRTPKPPRWGSPISASPTMSSMRNWSA